MHNKNHHPARLRPFTLLVVGGMLCQSQSDKTQKWCVPSRPSCSTRPNSQSR